MTAFAAESRRSRNSRSGSSGAGERDSIARNAATRTADAASVASVQISLQPRSLARVIAYTRSIRPAVTDAAPDVEVAVRELRAGLAQQHRRQREDGGAD